MHLDLFAFGVLKNQKVGNILENFTTESVMYVFFFLFLVFLYKNVCLCSLFLKTGYEMLRIYM